MQVTPQHQDVINLLFQYANNRTKLLISQKFAHYTTAENALNIIKGEQLWLRNAVVMNDFSEMEHGRKCLAYALSTDVGKRLGAVANFAFAGSWDEIEHGLNEQLEATMKQTYMVSLCEHDIYDSLGKLSMWRAYGGPTSGVALVFHTKVATQIVSGLPVYPSPVLYADAPGYENQLRKVVESMEKNVPVLKEVGRQLFVETVKRALMFSIMSCKHLGFKEEKEWRLIYLPEHGEANALITKSAETIRGTPQIVHKIPLKSDPQLGDIGLVSLLHEVIVGPTLYPEVVRDALEHALLEKKLPDVRQKIVRSDIPLRQWV